MNALSGDVNAPVVGKVKKGYLLVGGLVVLGLGVVYSRNRKAATAAASSSTDPNAQTYQPVPGGDLPGISGGSSSTIGNQVTNGPPFSSNAAWVQYAQAQLAAIENGPAPADVAAALGLYIAGQPVTADQRHIIEQAIAFAGAVPVAGPNGFPPSINQSVPNTGPTPPPPTQAPPPPVGHWVDTTGPGSFRTLAGIAAYRAPGGTAADIAAANPGPLAGIANPYGNLPNGLHLTIPWLDSNGHHI